MEYALAQLHALLKQQNARVSAIRHNQADDVEACLIAKIIRYHQALSSRGAEVPDAALRRHRGSQAHLLDSLANECRKGGSQRAADTISKSAELAEAKAEAERSGEVDFSVLIDRKLVPLLPAEAQEQRMSNLIQSLLVAACLGITPGLKKMPTSVLWGYFAYLSIASLPGSQFWERFLLFFVEPARQPPKFPGQAEAPWMGRVKWRTMIAFTLFQAIYCGAVYGITWIPIAGVVFPVPILLLIPAREYILPRIFGRRNLAALDPAPFEDEHGLPLRKRGGQDAESGCRNCGQASPGGSADESADPSSETANGSSASRTNCALG